MEDFPIKISMFDGENQPISRSIHDFCWDKCRSLDVSMKDPGLVLQEEACMHTHTELHCIILYHTYVLHVIYVLRVLRRYMHVSGQNNINKYISTVASAYAGVPLLFWCSQSRPEPICSKYLQTVRS